MMASSGPSQKFGMEMPTRDNVIAPTSMAVPGQTAATMPSGMRDEHRDQHRREGQLCRGRHAVQNLLRHRLIVAQRHAEISAQQTLKKRSVLNDERPIQAEAFAQLIDFVGRRPFAEHRLRGIAGDEVNERKNQGRDADQHRNRQHKPTDEIPKHRDGDAASVWPVLDG